MSDSDPGSAPSTIDRTEVHPADDLDAVPAAETLGDVEGESAGDVADGSAVVTEDELTEQHPAADALRAELDDVERSLARLDDGTYGTCEVCAVELGDDRLVSEPQLRFCAQHRRQ